MTSVLLNLDLQAILTWLVVAAATVALAIVLIRFWRLSEEVLQPVLLPIAMLGIGAAVLFGTDQGRDIGVALLTKPSLMHLALMFALFYWAIATWHTARVGLNQAFGQLNTGLDWQSFFIRWLPRLLGMLVFVLAIVSVKLAGFHHDAWREVLSLASLILATGLLYGLTVYYRRAIGRWANQLLNKKAPGMGRSLEAAFEQKDSGHNVIKWRNLTPATRFFWIFLLSMALVVVVWTWLDAMTVGLAGAMAISFFAFGAYLVALFGLRLCSSAWGVPFIPIILLVAVTTSAVRNFHPVRLCAQAQDCGATPSDLTTKASVADAAKQWYDEVGRSWRGGEAIPMIFVATAGGGLRASYWTAVVFEALEKALGSEGRDLFREHTFAISGVSGGSVGALMHVASNEIKATQALAEDFLSPAIASLAFVDIPSSILPNLQQPNRGVILERAWEQALLKERPGGVSPLAKPFLHLWRDEQKWQPALLFNSTHQETGKRVIASNLEIDQETFLDAWDLHELLEKDVPASTAAHNSARFTYVSPAGQLMGPDPNNTSSDKSYGHVIDGGYFENFGAMTLMQVARAALAEINEIDGAKPIKPIFIQISSDPALLDRDRARAELLQSCGHEGQRYLPFSHSNGHSDDDNGKTELKVDDGGLITFGNELSAPLTGILASREAHGASASKELAFIACSLGRSKTINEQQPLETGPVPLGTALLENALKTEPAAGPEELVKNDTNNAVDTSAVFVHLSMPNSENPPPLGWLLSQQSRLNIQDDIDCPRNWLEIGHVLKPFGKDERSSGPSDACIWNTIESSAK